MTTHIALLRAINVGGTKPVAMADLRAFFGELGFEDARSLLQTGNVVFGGGSGRGAELETLLESEAEKRLGLITAFMVRTAKEVDQIVARNPFPEEAADDPRHLVAMFLKDAPPAASVKALRAAISGSEIVELVGKQLYVVYPDGIGRSKLTNRVIESKLGTSCTGRNWNTVLKIAEVARA
jgi:uncharacterized protein (DUF1697 family)